MKIPYMNYLRVVKVHHVGPDRSKEQYTPDSRFDLVAYEHQLYSSGSCWLLTICVFEAVVYYLEKCEKSRF